ncbi:hypothetical protein [Leptotrichia shahii]|uniref:hypothetical protein n=1 Tax=Leptotrichia shahii TaxID=157691 RepID=UPI0028D0D659|nr:hypothetical protein [Leptotrichia shahii]
MKNKELKELKARNVLVEDVIKKIKIETDNINEKLEYSKKYKKIKACGTSEMRSDGKIYINKCNDKFCQICLTRERRKRFNKLKKIFEKSETKLEKGYVEAFLTLNFNYNSEDVKNMKLAEYLEYFQKMFKKFCEELKKIDCLGYIYKKEFPFIFSENKFNLHYHLWICIKKENLEKLQKKWHKITNGQGNLHIGNTKNENFGITQKFYECEENKRNISKRQVEKICNYLAKSYLSSAVKYDEKAENDNDKIGLVEDIKNKEVLEKMMKATHGQLENFKCLSASGIYNLTIYEKERKSEKSRMFEVFEYDPKILEEMKLPNADIFSDEKEKKLLLRFDVNNNTVEKIEKKFGGKAFVLKGKGKWSERLAAGNFKEVKRIGMKNIEKKPIKKKKTPVTTEKTTVETTFEIFGNIEEIKNKIVNLGDGAMTWATELVQVILPYTNIKQQSSDEDKQTIEKLEKRVKELEKETEKFKVAKTFSDEKQSEKSDFIVIQDENETIELEEYKMLSGGGYCYITKDKNKAYINTMFAKKYDKKSFRAERIEHYKNFEEFNKKYQLKKTF